MKKLTLSLALLVASAAPALAITVDTVPVGNAGNAKDQGNILIPNAFGAVSYVYDIGRFEVTVGQYAAFLNAVAASDPYGLYNAQMATDLNVAGVSRNGASGSYTYTVVGSPNHPITYVSWGDAARFTNWLHNSQPTGAQGSSTTETGAYTLNGAVTDSALSTVARDAAAKWFIPTENEWYKAAYYQPASQGGESDDYWEFPMTQVGNGIPYSDQPPGITPVNGRVANFYDNDSSANGYNDGYAVTGSISLNSNQNYLTDAGAYTLSQTYFGTFDQGGNVAEWNETRIGNFASGGRGLRGGSWGAGSGDLNAASRDDAEPTAESSQIGFRVAAISASTSGDFNGDGRVDAADYVVWRKINGSVADYGSWRTHFGQMTDAGVTVIASIPEPSAALLAVVATITSCGRQVRRQQHPAARDFRRANLSCKRTRQSARPSSRAFSRALEWAA